MGGGEQGRVWQRRQRQHEAWFRTRGHRHGQRRPQFASSSSLTTIAAFHNKTLFPSVDKPCLYCIRWSTSAVKGPPAKRRPASRRLTPDEAGLADAIVIIAQGGNVPRWHSAATVLLAFPVSARSSPSIHNHRAGSCSTKPADCVCPCRRASQRWPQTPTSSHALAAGPPAYLPRRAPQRRRYCWIVGLALSRGTPAAVEHRPIPHCSAHQ